MSAHITKSNRALSSLLGRVHVRGYVPFAPSRPLYHVYPHCEVFTSLRSVHHQPGTHPPITPVKPPPTITYSTHQCHIESAWSHLHRKLSHSSRPILYLSRNVFCWRKNEDGKGQSSNLSKTSEGSSVLGYGQKKNWIITTWQYESVTLIIICQSQKTRDFSISSRRSLQSRENHVVGLVHTTGADYTFLACVAHYTRFCEPCNQ